MRKKPKRESPSSSRTESKKAVSGPQTTPRRTAKPKPRPKSADTDELIQIWDEDLCE
ncbi:MAG: hypothetical protein IIA63_07830 [Nitrospinae bacterium]|nr:hypothetical protein [Nitrospinota bacterium]